MSFRMIAFHYPKEEHREKLIDALQGPLYFRNMIGHAPLDRKFASDLVDQVLKAVIA